MDWAPAANSAGLPPPQFNEFLLLSNLRVRDNGSQTNIPIPVCCLLSLFSLFFFSIQAPLSPPEQCLGDKTHPEGQEGIPLEMFPWDKNLKKKRNNYSEGGGNQNHVVEGFCGEGFYPGVRQ